MNENKALNWDDEISADADVFELLPPGEYPFVACCPRYADKESKYSANSWF